MDYLRVSLVIAPQFLAGCLIYLMLLKRSMVKIVELLSIGGVLGITACTIFDQLFVNLNLPRIGWITAIGIVLATFFVFKSLLGHETASVIWKNEFRSSILPICAIAIMALGTEWFWMFPSGVFFVTAAFISLAPKKRISSVLFKMSCLGGFASGVFMFSTRPKIWWMLEEVDYPFFAALSNSLAENGFHIHPLISDTELKYHWFTYAWIGLVQRVFEVPAFFVIGLIAPVIFTILTVALIWSIVNQVSQSNLQTLVLIAIVMAGSTFPLWGGGMKTVHLGSPSQFYAFSFLFTTLFFVLTLKNSEIYLSAFLIITLSAATLLSKVMHGLILALILFSFVIRDLYKKRSLQQSSSLLLGLGSIAFTYLIFIKIPASSDLFSLSFGGYSWQLQGDLKTFPSPIIGFIGAINVIALVATGISLVLYARLLSGPNQLVTVATLLLIFCCLMTFFLLGDYGENMYFLHAGLATATILTITIISEHNANNGKPVNFPIFYVLLGSCFAIFASLLPDLNSGAHFAILLRTVRTSFGFFCISVTITVLIFFKRSGIKKAIFSTLFLALAMSSTFTVINWSEQYQRKYNEFESQGTSYLGESDLIDVANWIRLNTSKDSVIASNYGWGGLSPSELGPYSSPCTALRDNHQSVETCRRTTDAKLVLYSERQAWLQATRAIWIQATPTNNTSIQDLITLRQKELVEFASIPNKSSSDVFLEAKIDWFVVDNRQLKRTSWEPFAEIRYSNDSFVVLEMNKSK